MCQFRSWSKAIQMMLNSSLKAFKEPIRRFSGIGSGADPWRTWREARCRSARDSTRVLRVARRCEAISIKYCPDITWRLIGKGIAGEQTNRAGIVVKKFRDQGQRPRIFFRRRHGGEPHLPVKTQLVRGDLRRPFVRSDGQRLIRIGFPVCAVAGSLRPSFLRIPR